MKIIKDFEGEDLEVSDFGEWIGKDYIDYKSEYKSNQKLIKILLQENQQLKQQLEKRDNIIKDVSDYINFLVIIDTRLAGGRFKDTIWGKELLEILNIDKGDE